MNRKIRIIGLLSFGNLKFIKNWTQKIISIKFLIFLFFLSSQLFQTLTLLIYSFIHLFINYMCIF